MNDEQFEAQRVRVRAIFDRWLGLLRLQGWQIIFHWDRTDGAERGHSFRSFMSCEPDWRYLHAVINVHLGAISEVDDDDVLEGYVVHELMHIHLSEISHDDETYRAHEERVATQLSRAFLEVRNQTRAAAVTLLSDSGAGI